MLLNSIPEWCTGSTRVIQPPSSSVAVPAVLPIYINTTSGSPPGTSIIHLWFPYLRPCVNHFSEESWLLLRKIPIFKIYLFLNDAVSFVYRVLPWPLLLRCLKWRSTLKFLLEILLKGVYLTLVTNMWIRNLGFILLAKFFFNIWDARHCCTAKHCEINFKRCCYWIFLRSKNISRFSW